MFKKCQIQFLMPENVTKHVFDSNLYQTIFLPQSKQKKNQKDAKKRFTLKFFIYTTGY